MLLTVVTGALATSVYGLPFLLAVVAIVVGNLVGAIFMALHSAQGPRLGVPQMMQTRGQFGSYGSLLVIAVVVVMYVGFFASNLVLAGQSLNVLTSGISVDAGILIVGAVSVVVTIFGYDLIHAYARLMTYLAGAALLLTFIWIVAVHGVGRGRHLGHLGDRLRHRLRVAEGRRLRRERQAEAPARRVKRAGRLLPGAALAVPTRIELHLGRMARRQVHRRPDLHPARLRRVPRPRLLTAAALRPGLPSRRLPSRLSRTRATDS